MFVICAVLCVVIMRTTRGDDERKPKPRESGEGCEGRQSGMSQATMKVQPKTKDQQTGAHAALTARRIVAYAVLILLCALCLFFFYVLIINATRPHADIQKGFSFLPGSWTSLCNNFTQVINNANIPIISGMRNSLIVSA